MASSSRIVRRIAAALMLSSSLTFAAVALSAQAQAQEPTTEQAMQAFDESQYTYCDAKIMAGFIGETVESGKVRIGSKILTGRADQIPGFLASARPHISCTWADTGHSYEDAEKLASAWGLPDAGAAKDKAAKLYTQGRSAEVLAALGGPSGAESSGDEAAVNAFYDSGFTYCDAKLVGAAWGTDTWQGKVAIGNKVLNNMRTEVEPILVQGRQVTACEFADTDVSYEDVEKLAGLWKVDVAQAKDKVADYYTTGQSAVVRDALGVPETAAPEPVGRANPDGSSSPSKNEN